MNLFDMLDSPIAYHRAFVHFGGVTGAVFLSQAIYWQKRTKQADGFFYKTAEEWESETGLTQREQVTARKRLVECGVLLEEKRGVPCKLHYKINKENLISLLRKTSINESAKPVSTNPQNWNSGKRETITEITTETTTEITTTDNIAESCDSPTHDEFETVWVIYGYKSDKKKSMSAYKSLSKIDKEKLVGSFEAYDRYLKVASWRNRKTLSAYINGRLWENDFESMIEEERRKQVKTANSQQQAPAPLAKKAVFYS